MSLQPSSPPPVPTLTAQVAHAAFPKGDNLYLKMRDELGTFFQDEQFADLYSQRGQPAETPWRLALITIFQFMENLSDRACANAVRSRLDWKYCLSLELTDSGFDYSVLSKFRRRLLAGNVEQQLLDCLLERFKEKGLLKARGKQRTDSTHILAAVRRLNRLEQMGETVRAALNALAVVVPDWLRQVAPTEWYERYSRPFEVITLPKSKTGRDALVLTIGQDGFTLLRAIYTSRQADWLAQVQAVQVLRRSWVYQYYIEDDQVQLRESTNQPIPSNRFESPYDTEASYASKRNFNWSGYKVQLTESCDEGEVHLITNVVTTKAATSDALQVEPIHQSLQTKELLPTSHLVDSAYVSSVQLVKSLTDYYGVELVGPLRDNRQWQASSQSGFAQSEFKIDWEAKQVYCPRGHPSHLWRERTDKSGQRLIHIDFHQRYCQPCPSRAKCTKAKNEPRELTLRPREHFEAMERRRTEQESAEWREGYKARAGIEGTISQGVRGFGLRQTRYRGQAKTHLQNMAIAAALNIERAVHWLCGEKPEKTRVSRFAALAKSA